MVSVIVPNYNHAAYLERRINSILNQTYQDFEVILLDDCSNDNSRNILFRFKDHPKVTHMVLNDSNSGSTFKQWEKGFRLASADLIWIAESDDWAEPTLLEELVAPFISNPAISVSFCQTLCVDSQNNILYKTESNSIHNIIPGSNFVAAKMFYGNSIMNASMAVFRKSLVNSIDWSFTSMRFCGDWYFWVQLALLGDVHESGKYLSYFYKHGNDVTSKATTQGLFFIEGYKVMLYIKENVAMSKQNYVLNLDILVNYYLAQKRYFVGEGINDKVLACLQLVDKDIKSLIRQKKYKYKYKNIISRLFHL